MRAPGLRASGLAMLTALAATYPWFGPHVGHPLAVFAIPPLVMSAVATTRVVTEIATLAAIVAVVEGIASPDLPVGALLVRCVVLSVACAVSVVGVRLRTGRERALLDATSARDALSERLRSITGSLHAGRLGTWRWDATAGVVVWDEDLAALFGRTLDEFDGTFEGWLAFVHPDDRARCVEIVEAAAVSGRFSFEHRCVWPDGSVHWLEGAGEPILGEDGSLRGAVGVTTAIDARRAQEDERARLLLVEQRSRERSEYLARAAQAVGASLDIDALTTQIADAAVLGLADWCRLTLLLDDLDPLVRTAAAHVDSDVAVLIAELESRHPYDQRRSVGLAHAVREQRTLYHRDITPEQLRNAFADPAYGELLVRLDLRSAVVVPIRTSSGVVGAIQLVRTSHRAPFEPEDVRVAEELAVIIGIAVENAINFERQRRARLALDVLQRLSGRLALALRVDEIVDAVIEEGVKGLSADGAMVYLVDEREALRLAACTGYPPEKVRAWEVLDPGRRTPAAEAYRTSSVVAVERHADLVARYPGLGDVPVFDQALVALPLAIRQVSFGSILFSFRRPRRILAEEHAMLETFAARGAGALERAGLYERQRDASLLLQRRMLPELPVLPAWLDAAAHYQPATGGEVGGDWYQLLEVDDDRCAAVLGDAVGRGVPAAAAMGQLRGVVTGAASVDASPACVVASADRFASQSDDTVAASLAYALVDRCGDEIHYASAGHLPPLVLRADGSVEVLDDARGPLLGVRPVASPPVAHVPFHAGDTLVLYSDGLVERRDETIDAGIARLQAALRGRADMGAVALRDQLVRTFVDPAGLDDDVAVFVLRRLR